MTQAIWNGTIVVDGTTNRADVWQDRKPSPVAKNIKGHVAFGGGVKLKRTPTESRDPEISAPGLLRRLLSAVQSR